jgi:predicted transcriptional regulator
VKTISTKADRAVLLRLPDSMRKRLQKVAKSENRSMNAVIMVALARYFEVEGYSPPASKADIEAALKDFEDRMLNRFPVLAELIKKGSAGEGEDASPKESVAEAALKNLEEDLDRKLAELTKKTPDTDEHVDLIKKKIK